MAKNTRHNVPKRRKREQKTNYKKRLTLLKKRSPRLVVRISNKYIFAQLVEYNPDGDKTIISFSSKGLKKYGWEYSFKNVPAAYLTGRMIAGKIIEKGIKNAVLDIGMNSFSFRFKAVLKGIIDQGLDVPHGEKTEFPDELHLKGETITAYMKNKKSTAQFSSYKNNNITKKFDDIIKKIEGK
jgi:large subunit ribosomal protein L18